MPRGDRTGPAGMGPMTGRGFGYCAGYGAPGYVSAPGPGMGMAWGFGRGRGRGGYGLGMGWGRGYYGPAYYGWGPAMGTAAGPAAPENQRQVLKDEMTALEERIRYLQREMDAMEKGDEE
ncbi:MAG: DUF5320 domain-containing protein [Spirochaetota bacterium]|nr:DUF5320 domain-containing protein [Spirochaetota bacterium]